MRPEIVETDRRILDEPGAVLARASEVGAVAVRGFWSPARAAEAAAAVLREEARWTWDFDGVQACLGRAWYAHLGTDRTREYFAGVAAGDAAVRQVLPGLQEELDEALAAMGGAPVARRRGWAGAGVHVFPEGGRCARVGGAIHFDDEGLTPAQIRKRAPALSLVLMLRGGSGGGGLKVFDARFEGRHSPTLAQRRSDAAVVSYGPGDLVGFDLHRLHQIQPFEGGPRLSATLHGAVDAGRWSSWF